MSIKAFQLAVAYVTLVAGDAEQQARQSLASLRPQPVAKLDVM